MFRNHFILDTGPPEIIDQFDVLFALPASCKLIRQSATFPVCKSAHTPDRSRFIQSCHQGGDQPPEYVTVVMLVLGQRKLVAELEVRSRYADRRAVMLYN
jgi:hypothetical protein